MQETKNIIICGVGGQGTILASDIISDSLFMSGFDVKKCEIHGMSQRQGSVVSYIRYGEKVYSPVISENEADFIIGFEKLEALRYIPLLKENSIAIVQDLEIPPISVLFGNAKYPEDFSEIMSKKTKNIYLIETKNLLKEFGNPKVFNTFMLGIFSKNIPQIKENFWIESIKKNVKKEYIEINLKAFEKGKNFTLK
jgi:indolepyruvate ferredoxin oxidoreductase beta subunit